jgi:hypothetical protein
MSDKLIPIDESSKCESESDSDQLGFKRIRNETPGDLLTISSSRVSVNNESVEFKPSSTTETIGNEIVKSKEAIAQERKRLKQLKDDLKNEKRRERAERKKVRVPKYKEEKTFEEKIIVARELCLFSRKKIQEKPGVIYLFRGFLGYYNTLHADRTIEEKDTLRFNNQILVRYSHYDNYYYERNYYL